MAMTQVARFDGRTWSAAQRSEAAECVHRYGFAVVEHAATPEDIGTLTTWLSASQAAQPLAWPTDPRDGQRLHSQPLLEEAEVGDDDAAPQLLDAFLRPPRIYELISTLLGGEACFAQMDFRDCPRTDRRSTKDHFHHDTGAAGTSDPDVIEARSIGHHDTLCSVLYLTDVGPESCALAVVPSSHRVAVRRPVSVPASADTIVDADAPTAGWQRWWERDQVKAACQLPPVRIEGLAGTVVIYDVSLFHAKAVGVAGSGARLTLHQYFGRLSNQPNIGWALVPRRLAEADDRELRRFVSNLTPVQAAFAECGYDLRRCAESAALRQHLLSRIPAVIRETMSAAELRGLGKTFLAQHCPATFVLCSASL